MSFNKKFLQPKQQIHSNKIQINYGRQMFRQEILVDSTKGQLKLKQMARQLLPYKSKSFYLSQLLNFKIIVQFVYKHTF